MASVQEEPLALDQTSAMGLVSVPPISHIRPPMTAEALAARGAQGAASVAEVQVVPLVVRQTSL